MKTTTRRWVALSAASALFLAGCGSGDDTDDTEETTDQIVEEGTDGDDAESDDTESEDGDTEAGDDETYIFTDSSGR
ncbi:MAG: hypothetical protein QMB98_07525 [Flaviflexus sp.]|uniref:hypothetical protein n=1 Tax=Flaviflexus sp. TaxID=1969482 RepID=UPI00352E7807